LGWGLGWGMGSRVGLLEGGDNLRSGSIRALDACDDDSLSGSHAHHRSELGFAHVRVTATLAALEIECHRGVGRVILPPYADPIFVIAGAGHDLRASAFPERQREAGKHRAAGWHGVAHFEGHAGGLCVWPRCSSARRFAQCRTAQCEREHGDSGRQDER